ncbi:MAG: DUF485 domain-containing protein [Proteobacteria bacterium]|nr:DUF485 domain-containing protein [Pseudomonadota bacterium]
MSEQELVALARRRWRVSLLLTATIVVVYFGFIAMVAFARDTVASLVGDTVSVGIVLGAATIVLAPLLTGIYVWWSNRHYDAAAARLRSSTGDGS